MTTDPEHRLSSTIYHVYIAFFSLIVLQREISGWSWIFFDAKFASQVDMSSRLSVDLSISISSSCICIITLTVAFIDALLVSPPLESGQMENLKFFCVCFHRCYWSIGRARSHEVIKVISSSLSPDDHDEFQENFIFQVIEPAPKNPFQVIQTRRWYYY